MRRPEQKLQIAVVQFLRWAWPPELPWWHTPNGFWRTKSEASLQKAMGVLAGVADLTFILPNGQAAFIELKAGSALSSEQIEFRRKALALKCGYAVCSTVDEVEAVTGHWLGLFGRRLRARVVA